MLIDATDRDISRSGLVGSAWCRNEILGTAMAADAFSIIDAIWMQDDRIGELRGECECG